MSRLFRFSTSAMLFGLLLAYSSLAVAAQNDQQPDQALPWTWSLADYRDTSTILVGDDDLQVEISDDSALRSRGLSYRDGLADGTGMLFVYDDEGARSFWMKGMQFCLDIIWIDGTEIVGAAENACPEPGVDDGDLMRFVSPSPVRFVLEVPAGWLEVRGYGPGTPVDLGNIAN